MRIHKALSESEIVSLRKAEDLIRFGQVTVNGHPAFIGQDIDPMRDIVCIDGERVYFERDKRMYYIMLNKPRGYVTTMQDELGRRCVAELVEDVPARVYPIGRLDKDSEGLLLLTNDGDFANYIMHPSHHVTKTYRVTVRPYVTEEQLIALSTGVVLDDGYQTAPAQVEVETDEPGRAVLRITIGEGKNRQIRRMCEALGLEVARLRRVSVGPLKLGMLQPGEWRELKPAEIGALRNAVAEIPVPPAPRKPAPPVPPAPAPRAPRKPAPAAPAPKPPRASVPRAPQSPASPAPASKPMRVPAMPKAPAAPRGGMPDINSAPRGGRGGAPISQGRPSSQRGGSSPRGGMPDMGSAQRGGRGGAPTSQGRSSSQRGGSSPRGSMPNMDNAPRGGRGGNRGGGNPPRGGMPGGRR